MLCSVDIPERLDFFSVGNKGGVDLGERRGGGRDRKHRKEGSLVGI